MWSITGEVVACAAEAVWWMRSKAIVPKSSRLPELWHDGLGAHSVPWCLRQPRSSSWWSPRWGHGGKTVAKLATGVAINSCFVESGNWKQLETTWKCLKMLDSQCGRAICRQRGFQESSGWVVPWSREGATKAATGNRCIESSSVCIAGLHLWWAAWSTSASWSRTPRTGKGLRLAKVSKCDWGRHPFLLRHQCCPASSARSAWPSFFKSCLQR